jgi:mannosyltransferase OCH1-like enzyme
MQIPHVVHQIWLQGVERLPRYYRAAAARWKARNPGWTHRVWDEPSIRALMRARAPDWAPIFDGQPELEAKADVGRYALLEALGGVYADIDTECRRPVARLLQGPARLHVTCYSGDSRDPVACATNSVIASSPRHPIWPRMLAAVAANDRNLMVVFRTGPEVLRPILRAYAEDHPGDVRVIGFPHAITTAMMSRRWMRCLSWVHRENCILDFNDSARRAAAAERRGSR